MDKQTTQCPYCKEEIVFGAIKCKHCHSDLLQCSNNKRGFAITSIIFGIIVILASFDKSEWDSDTLDGLFIFSGLGLFFGIMTITQKYGGKNIAIAGIIMSCIGLLEYISLISK